jgi:hypothetical protein
MTTQSKQTWEDKAESTQVPHATMLDVLDLPLLPNERYALLALIRAGAVMQDYAGLVMRVNFALTDLEMSTDTHSHAKSLHDDDHVRKPKSESCRSMHDSGEQGRASTQESESDVGETAGQMRLRHELEACAARGVPSCWADLGVLAIKSSCWAMAVKLLKNALRCMPAKRLCSKAEGTRVGGKPASMHSEDEDVALLEGRVRTNLGVALVETGQMMAALVQVCPHASQHIHVHVNTPIIHAQKGISMLIRLP